MKTVIALLIVAALLGGCALFEEAYYLDREFGQATQTSMAAQIAHPERAAVERTPSQMEGIVAEQVMDVHNQSYAKTPAKTKGIEMSKQHEAVSGN